MDMALRTLDPEKVYEVGRRYGLPERRPDKPIIAEAGMRYAILGKPSLADMHDDARQWLREHGFREPPWERPVGEWGRAREEIFGKGSTGDVN